MAELLDLNALVVPNKVVASAYSSHLSARASTSIFT